MCARKSPMPQVLIVCCAKDISGTETWGLSLSKVSFKGHDTVPPALPPMFVPLYLKERDTGRQVIKIISNAVKTVLSSYILVNYALGVLLFRTVHVSPTQHSSCLNKQCSYNIASFLSVKVHFWSHMLPFLSWEVFRCFSWSSVLDSFFRQDL